MIHWNEIVMLVIGVAVFSFSLAYAEELKRIPHWLVLRLAFYILLTAWAVTIVEGFILETTLNILEHLCYACGSLLLAVWCWKLSFGRKVGSE
ncbi:MAG: hypothetical protein JXM70_11900 [Pirellulales bacterium]|nr:hypothetical protein [Pirellulales bacterium]